MNVSLCRVFRAIQEYRGRGCEDTCALCTDDTTPCQKCLKGNPSVTICKDDPDTRIFWDGRHPTTEFHRVFAEAVRQCAKKKPNYRRPWVEVLCPKDAHVEEEKALHGV